MRASLAYGCLLLATMVGSHLTHVALDEAGLPQPERLEETLPSPYATRLLSLGHYSLAADYYWMRSLVHFGDSRSHRVLYPNLEPFIQRSLALDPQFKSIYFLAGTALTLKGMDYELSNRILERGLIERPDVWEIPFYLGFNYYYFDHDFARAAETLALAAKDPDAPDYVWGMATRLSAEGQNPDVGLALVNSILAGMEEDDPARADFEERQRLLRLEVELGLLQQAADRYAEIEGKTAQSLDELVNAGAIRYVPDEPLGGQYGINKGRVTTSNEARRLRLSELARTKLGTKP